MTPRRRIGAPFSSVAPTSANTDDRARQRRDDLVFAGLLFVLAAKGINPMQLEAAVAGTQIELVTFDHGNDMGFHAIQCHIEAAGF